MKKKVLLVDDNKDFALLFQAKFSHIGEIQCVYSYEEALKALAEGPWDLFFLDHNLDGKTCFDLIPAIRSSHSRSHIIIVTGHSNKEMAINAVNYGVSGFIEKPIMEEEMTSRLQAIDWFSSSLILNQLNRSASFKGRSCPLTRVEYIILETLYTKSRQLITREELEQNIWGGRHVAKNSLDTHLYNLKRKIPELKDHLSSVHGSGYILNI